jgi:hypothetical protein
MTFHSALQPAVTSADADACDAGFGDVDERGSMGVHVRFLFSSRTGEALPRRYASPSRIDMDRPARRVHLSHVIRHTCLALPSVRLVQARETMRRGHHRPHPGSHRRDTPVATTGAADPGPRRFEGEPA